MNVDDFEEVAEFGARTKCQTSKFNSAERGAAALRDFPRTLGVLALASDLRCVFHGLTMRTAVVAVGRSHAAAVLVCALFSAFHNCSPHEVNRG
jgi:hypothetical protein